MSGKSALSCISNTDTLFIFDSLRNAKYLQLLSSAWKDIVLFIEETNMEFLVIVLLILWFLLWRREVVRSLFFSWNVQKFMNMITTIMYMIYHAVFSRLQNEVQVTPRATISFYRYKMWWIGSVVYFLKQTQVQMYQFRMTKYQFAK